MSEQHSNVGQLDRPSAEAASPSADLPPPAAVAPPEGSPSPTAYALETQQHPFLALPDDLIATVLSHKWSAARAASRAFRSLADSSRTHLRMQRPDGVDGPTPQELTSMLARLPQLCTLDCTSVRVRDLGPLAVPSLTSLDARMGSLDHDYISTATHLGPLATCTRLTSLRLTRCTRLSDITGLHGAASSLLTLSLRDSHSLRDLSPLAACVHLVHLSVGGHLLIDLGALEGCLSLQTLTICNCDALTCLEPLAACPALASLTLSRLPRLSDVAPLAACQALERVVIIKCCELKDWRPLAGCPALRRLRAEEGGGVRACCQAVVALRPQVSVRYRALPPPWARASPADWAFDSD